MPGGTKSSGLNSCDSNASTTVNAEPAEHAESLFLLISDEPFGTRSPRSGPNSSGSHTSTTVNAEHSFSIDL